MRFVSVGSAAVLVETDDPAALFAASRDLDLAVTEIVPAATTVLYDGVRDLDALREALEGLRVSSGGAARRDVVEVPCVYDGADIDSVAGLWGMTTREVVEKHTTTQFVVAFCGFSPGFAYCTGLPEELSVPRLDRPRPKVPAGSVGLAGAFTGVYPTASPGGWRLLGRTEMILWDDARDDPATLPPGTPVRFTEVSR